MRSVTRKAHLCRYLTAISFNTNQRKLQVFVKNNLSESSIASSGVSWTAFWTISGPDGCLDQGLSQGPASPANFSVWPLSRESVRNSPYFLVDSDGDEERD